MCVVTFFRKSADNESSPEKYFTSCAAGEIITVEKINDSVFSSGILGDGFGLIPDDNVLCSPVNGVVKDVTNNGLAINIKTDDGLLVLIHVGMNLSRRGDTGASVLVNVGDKVSSGDPIYSLSLADLVNDGYDTTIAIIVTNSDMLRSFRVRSGKVDKANVPVVTYTV